MKCKITEVRLGAIGKMMRKEEDNLCRQALIEGQKTCYGKDLLTEYIERNVKRFMSHLYFRRKTNERRENDNDIRKSKVAI